MTKGSKHFAQTRTVSTAGVDEPELALAALRSSRSTDGAKSCVNPGATFGGWVNVRLYPGAFFGMDGVDSENRPSRL